MKNWMGQIQQHADFNVNKILMGNKSDADSNETNLKRVVSTDEGKALAAEYGLDFYETSAKNNANVVAAFENIAKQVVKRLKEENEIKVSGSQSQTKPKKVDLSQKTDKSKYNCACN